MELSGDGDRKRLLDKHDGKTTVIQPRTAPISCRAPTSSDPATATPASSRPVDDAVAPLRLGQIPIRSGTFIGDRGASNYTVYGGLSDGIRLSPAIYCPRLELLGAPAMPAPFGVTSHLDEQRVPFLQDAKSNADSLGGCGLLFLVECIGSIGVTDLTTKPQA